jgi:hypothetical protein
MVLVTILGFVFFLVPGIRLAKAQRMSSFQSTVLDKRKETTMIYTGVFIPLVIYYLKVEPGIELKVSYTVYRSLDIGNTVLVSRFSDGSYRLDQ